MECQRRLKHIFDALNLVYNERERRNFFVLNLVSLAFTAGALTFLVLALGAVVVLPGCSSSLASARTPGGSLSCAGRYSCWLCSRSGGTLPLRPEPGRAALALVTGAAPSRRCSGSGGSLLFSWYVANFRSYNKTYGSLGAAIGFMTWIWISTTIVLLGAQVNAEMEHQTAEDTTVGEPQPLGTRGAKMADSRRGGRGVAKLR